MKKVLLLTLIVTFFGCETLSDPSYGGVFTGGLNTYKLQQGSDDYATMIKDVVLGYADGNFEEIIVNFSDSVTRREPGNVYKVAPSIERWKSFKENFDSINRNLTSVMAVKVNDDYSFVDALFSQQVYKGDSVTMSRDFERYWINHETNKIVSIAFISEEYGDEDEN